MESQARRAAAVMRKRAPRAPRATVLDRGARSLRSEKRPSPAQWIALSRWRRAVKGKRLSPRDRATRERFDAALKKRNAWKSARNPTRAEAINRARRALFKHIARQAPKGNEVRVFAVASDGGTKRFGTYANFNAFLTLPQYGKARENMAEKESFSHYAIGIVSQKTGRMRRLLEPLKGFEEEKKEKSRGKKKAVTTKTRISSMGRAGGSAKARRAARAGRRSRGRRPGKVRE